MKLKVDWWDFYGERGGYYVFQHSWLWGWERYDDIGFPTREAAVAHARDVKALAS